MKRWMMIVAALGLALSLRAAEAAPEVKPSGTPEVTDPDLKDATPIMRQGTDEPLGGFKDAGMKGKSALSLGWANGAHLGYSYWIADSAAVRASVGGSVNESQWTGVHAYNNGAIADLGLRWRLMNLAQLGIFFAQTDVFASLSGNHSIQKTDNVTYATYVESHSESRNYGGSLALGAEIFWPGSRRVSLEAMTNLSASWGFTETQGKTYSDPVGVVATSETKTSSRTSGFSSSFSPITAAINIYF